LRTGSLGECLDVKKKWEEDWENCLKRNFIHDFRLLPWCKWNQHSCEVLYNTESYFVSDNMVQPISPIFRGQPTVCPEMSVTKYLSILRKIPEEYRHQELYNLYLWSKSNLQNLKFLRQ
jgi:hypothetical protein